MKNIRFFLSKNFQFLVVKFSIYFRNVKNFGLSKWIQIRVGVEQFLQNYMCSEDRSSCTSAQSDHCSQGIPWVAKAPKPLQAHSEETDQPASREECDPTAQMHRMILAFYFLQFGPFTDYPMTYYTPGIRSTEGVFSFCLFHLI